MGHFVRSSCVLLVLSLLAIAGSHLVTDHRYPAQTCLVGTVIEHATDESLANRFVVLTVGGNADLYEHLETLTHGVLVRPITSRYTVISSGGSRYWKAGHVGIVGRPICASVWPLD